MIRGIGAIMIILGSVGLGVRSYASLLSQVHELEDYTNMLDILRCEIELRLAPIEHALVQASLAGRAGAFANAVLHGIRCRGGAEIDQAWVSATDQAPREIRSILLALAPILGRYDAVEQGRAISDARTRIDKLRSLADSNCRRSGRLYITFGICGGVAITLLFL